MTNKLNLHELFYVRQEGVSGEELVFDAEESRHIAASLRKSKGQAIWATDGQGNRFEAEITETKPMVRAGILSRIDKSEQPHINLTLAQAIIKGERFDWLVEKAVELGVGRIIPFTSRFTSATGTDKIDRWRRVALAAMKQSQRLFLPEIHPTVSFEEMLRLSEDSQIRLIAHAESERSVHDVLASKPKTVFGLVGPEGGFSNEEIQQARDAGFVPVKLSDARLRAETAGAALTVLVMG
jgi:16S rRNA (uracil1498-N3)-methyltransferase